MSPLVTKTQGIVTPLSASRMLQLATLVRTVGADGTDKYTITNASDPAPTFKCALLPSKTFSAPASDIAPRQWRNKLELFYLAKVLGVAQTPYDPGARVEIEDVVYEAVSEPLVKRVGTTTWAYSQNVLPVSQLWPNTATLTNLQGDEVPDIGEIPFAVWESTSDRYASRGRYDDTEGEVPVDFAEAVKGTNVALLSGTRKYKIQSAHCHFSQPHISLRLVSVDA